MFAKWDDKVLINKFQGDSTMAKQILHGEDSRQAILRASMSSRMR